MRVLVRAPDHLGDGVMALPAVAALCELGTTTVAGPPWVPDLYRHLKVAALEPEAVPGVAADLAVLLKPSFSAAWATRRTPRRVGLATDGRRLLLTTAVPARGPHRVDDLRAVAIAAGASPGPLPRYPCAPGDLPDSPPLPPDFVLLVPGTASPETVRWPGFRALAERLGARAVFAGGPADAALIGELAGPHLALPPLSIPAFAALSVRAAAVVGNDSGLPHLAAAARRAAGLPVSDVHVVYGSTDPARTGPPGSTPHGGTRPDCWPCYRKSCAIGTPCLDTGVEALASALRST